MSNWGIPDWLDPGAYGNTKQWSRWRWRWEFTRRRDDCRKDFLRHTEETVPVPEKVRAECAFCAPLGTKRPRLLRPDEPGFVASVPGCYEKYGLHTLPNPAIGD